MNLRVAVLALVLASAGGASGQDLWMADAFFEDARLASPLTIEGKGLLAPVAVGFSFGMERRLALYDRAWILPDGTVMLDSGPSWAPIPDGPPEGELRLEPLGGLGVVPGPDSRVLVDPGPERLVIRFLRWTVPSTGESVTYEIVLYPDGEIAYQYLYAPVVPARVALEKGDGIERVVPSEEGFLPTSGGAARFPNGRPVSRAGCGQDIPWCDRIRNTGNNACLRGTTMGASCRTVPCSPCSQTSSNVWHFNETNFCQTCPYSLYVVVECGTEMHLPVFDMEGGDFIITDVFTGTVQSLTGINDCAKPPPTGGFIYCNRCALGFGGIGDPSQSGTCGVYPEIACAPYIQTSSHIQWGVPEPLPCGPPNTSTCPADQASGGQTAHDQQVTDVILNGNPGLCGVFRMDIVSGGLDWMLYANCTGDDTPNYVIYQNCADALAAFNPLPELVITDFWYEGVCPNIVLHIIVENIGCVDAPRSPVRIEYGNRTINQDLGYVPVNGAVEGIVPVALSRTPIDVTVSVDADNAIVECKEDAGAVACAKAVGQESLTKAVCVCANTVFADTTLGTYFACERGTATIDAGPSYIEPCTGGVREYQFLDSQGIVQRPWGPDPTFTFPPARCPSLETWTVEARCSLETIPECVSSVIVTVECALNPAVAIVPDRTDVCEGDVVTLDAGTGFAQYRWSTGETTRTIRATPGVPFEDYTVDVVNTKGCPGTDTVRIHVTPDALPGPVGITLRAEKRDPDVVFRWQDLPPGPGAYQLVGYLPDGGVRPCASRKPPETPGPPRMDGLADVIAQVAPGVQQAVHAGGVEACPSVIFYKVRGLSACRGTPGGTCNFPCGDPNVCYQGCP